MATRPRLLLFARVPQLGRVKTRLEPVLGALGCLGLYRAFLDDASRAYLNPSWDAHLLAEPDPDDPALAAAFPPPWRREAQAAGDLGEKLASAFESSFADGAPAAVAVGSDHPMLDLTRLADALDAARSRGAAVVPAQDGGYCAIALSARVDPGPLFAGIPWSTAAVLDETLWRLAQAGVSPEILPPSYDVDRPEDLVRLRRDLARLAPSASGFPTATARALEEIAVTDFA